MVNNNFSRKINQLIEENLLVIRTLKTEREKIAQVASLLVRTYEEDKKILVCGNGGSAADAQHLATELVCRFEKNRKPLRCLALTTNTSLLTATANDFGFIDIFSRQVTTWGEPGDVLIAISTSGNSPNVLKAVTAAQKQKMTVVGLTGKDGGKLKSLADICIKIPATVTARIQEGHILVIHILCKLLEDYFFA